VGSAFDMAGQDMADRAAPLERGIERIDRSTGDAEGATDAFLLQDTYRGIDRSHIRHFAPRLTVLILIRSSRLVPAISTDLILFPAMWNEW
jgi:hypothetical protein